jgi:hypothetical protein
MFIVQKIVQECVLWNVSVRLKFVLQEYLISNKDAGMLWGYCTVVDQLERIQNQEAQFHDPMVC